MKWYEYLFPTGVKCIFCGKECGDFAICDDCYRTLDFIDEHCIICGGERIGADVCPDCYGRHYDYNGSTCIFRYDGVIRDKIFDLKNSHARNVGIAFSRIMYDAFVRLKWDIDIVIPVPIHPEREKLRGYNQCELLCGYIAENAHIVRTDILVRVKDTPHQTGLTRHNREENLSHAFKVMDRKSIKNKNILLVDDIYTTGSTINECVRTLKKAGAKNVYALCLARTPVKLPM